MKVTFVSSDQGLAGKLRSLRFEDPIDIQSHIPLGFDARDLKNQPDLFLLEITDERPELGLAVIESVRKRESFRNTPIVVISNKPTKDSIRIMHQAGVRDLISKSIEPEILIERLKKYFQSRPAPSAVHPSLSAVGVKWHDKADEDFKKRVRVETKAHLEMLPSLPTVVTEILKLVEDHKSTAADFEDRIRQDQALAARILRMANAGFFAQEKSIQSIHEATLVLGVQTLKSLVIASSTNHLFDRSSECYGYSRGGMWKHSISCALGSQFLGRYSDLDDREVDELFVKGLLHDIGKLLLCPFVSERSDEFRKAIGENRMGLLDAEMQILGTNHCLMGIEIANHWKLPPEVRDAIEFHERPGENPDASFHVKIVHAANFFCHLNKLGMIPETHFSPKLDPHVEEEFDLTPDKIEKITPDWNTHLEEANKLFALLEN